MTHRERMQRESTAAERGELGPAIAPAPVVRPDDRGQWLLYVDGSCQEVIGFFPERADAEFCRTAYAAAAPRPASPTPLYDLMEDGHAADTQG